MTCAEAAPLIPDIHTGKISRAQRMTVIRHCQECEKCCRHAAVSDRRILDCLPEEMLRKVTE